MISGWTIYWVTRMDAVGNLLLVLAVSFFALGVLAITTSDVCDAAKEEARDRLAAKLILLSVVLAVLTALTPSTKEVAAILVLPRIANSAEMQQLGGEVLGLAHEWLEELKPAPDAEPE